MNRIALITGATSGIGKASSVLLAKNGFDLIITGRRKTLLDELKGVIESISDSKALCLNFDIRENNQVEEHINNLSGNWRNIDLLINNAGLAAGLEPLNNGLLSDWEAMIDTNVKGLLYITKIISTMMIERKQGHIINISSLAGKEAYYAGNVYCATKHAVDALTKGLRLDLLKHNIKVGSISPGMVETEFSLVRFHGDESRANNVYKGFIPLSADDIGEAILFMVTRPPHVNIDDILIMPTAQGLSRDVNRTL